MRLGCHMSIAGGLYKALERGHALSCETIQVFTKNASRWVAKPLTSKDVEQFRRTRERTGINPVVAHDSYLINLASPKPDTLEKSISALKDELTRADLLDIPYLVMHPGSHLGQGEEKGLVQIASALRRIIDETPDSKVRILLETTAGQGTNLGSRFEHLSRIMEMAGYDNRLGVCLDTCHIYAAGYDITTEYAYKRTKEEFQRIVGLDNLFVIHLNDSKKGCGSHIDRHEHIGRGQIGLDAFRYILHDPDMVHLPGILETPKEKDRDGTDMDLVNMNILRDLMDSGK